MAVPRFVGGPVAQPMDDAQPTGPLSNPWLKYGLIAVGALVAIHFLKGGGTRTAPAVTTVPDTNNLSTLGNLSNAITQDYAQNQKFQQDFLTWLHNQNGGGSLPIDGSGQMPPTTNGGGRVVTPGPGGPAVYFPHNNEVPGQVTPYSDPGYYNGPTPGSDGGSNLPVPAYSWAWRWSNWFSQQNPGTDTSPQFGSTPAGPAYSWEWTWLKTPGDLNSGPAYSPAVK